MFCVIIADILYAKVINYKGKTDKTQVVLPKSQRCCALVVSVVIEMCFKQLLRTYFHVC